MPTRRVLYTSKEVRKQIVELFSDATKRRVAISAYVGDGAEAYLPRPAGLHLVCSPTPGGTNPGTIRFLMSRGVKAEFVDFLHMKVYWCEGRGVVVASANLSTNALGAGGLKEFGVRMDAQEVDIDRVLRGLKRVDASTKLHWLDREHRA
jgi:hypothetical protein